MKRFQIFFLFFLLVCGAFSPRYGLDAAPAPESRRTAMRGREITSGQRNAIRPDLKQSVLPDPQAASGRDQKSPAGKPFSLSLEAPIQSWDEGLPLGNGIIGGLGWGEGTTLNLSL